MKLATSHLCELASSADTPYITRHNQLQSPACTSSHGHTPIILPVTGLEKCRYTKRHICMFESPALMTKLSQPQACAPWFISMINYSTSSAFTWHILHLSRLWAQMWWCNPSGFLGKMSRESSFRLLHESFCRSNDTSDTCWINANVCICLVIVLPSFSSRMWHLFFFYKTTWMNLGWIFTSSME